MAIAAFLCIAIGIFPGLLYDLLPYSMHFEPYTPDHITGSLGILMFTALGFFLLLKKLKPELAITIDTDWFYRKGAKVFMWVANKPIAAYENFVSNLSNTAILRPLYSVADISNKIDKYIVDGAVNGIASLVMFIGGKVRWVQTGLLPHYAVGIVLGILAIITAYTIIR